MSNYTNALHGLQQHINNYLANASFDEVLDQKVNRAQYFNAWFSPLYVKQRLHVIANANFNSYNLGFTDTNITEFALLTDERVPLDAFFIVTQLLFANKHIIYPIAENNDKVLEYLLNLIPNNNITFTKQRIKNVHAYIIDRKQVNNTLQEYFINRNSLFLNCIGIVAVLTGNENKMQLQLLASGIFHYFGQGKYSIRKIYVPANYEIRQLYPYFEEYAQCAMNNNYANNYGYNQSVYLMNLQKHYDNGFLLLKEDEAPIAPTGVMFYQFYENKLKLIETLTRTQQYTGIFEPSTINAPINMGLYDYLSLQPTSTLNLFITGTCKKH